ncbi:MAG: hypothetical protein KAJ29_01500, partial [Alphaproteobacteria bacterium]|nr:hypothetical protein [Alphaproteobacteria bacterium]
SKSSPEAQADICLRMLLFAKLGSFDPPGLDRSEFDRIKVDLAGVIKEESDSNKALMEKYGGTIPEEILNARRLGMVHGIDREDGFDNIVQSIRQGHPELAFSNIEDLKKDITDEEMLADIEKAYAQGQNQGKVLVSSIAALEKMMDRMKQNPERENNAPEKSLRKGFYDKSASPEDKVKQSMQDTGVTNHGDTTEPLVPAKPDDPSIQTNSLSAP